MTVKAPKAFILFSNFQSFIVPLFMPSLCDTSWLSHIPVGNLRSPLPTSWSKWVPRSQFKGFYNLAFFLWLSALFNSSAVTIFSFTILHMGSENLFLVETKIFCFPFLRHWWKDLGRAPSPVLFSVFWRRLKKALPVNSNFRPLLQSCVTLPVQWQVGWTSGLQQIRLFPQRFPGDVCFAVAVRSYTTNSAFHLLPSPNSFFLNSIIKYLHFLPLKQLLCFPFVNAWKVH